MEQQGDRLVQDGRIDLIATDHAPHTLDEKRVDSYFASPAGLPLVQHVLQMAFGLVPTRC